MGFRSMGQTQANLILLLGHLLENKNSKATYITFLDLKASFDLVDHRILFNKLEQSNIVQNDMNIIKLLYGSMHIKIDEELIPINRGTSQGSLLSPHFFNVYLNDLLMK